MLEVCMKFLIMMCWWGSKFYHDTLHQMIEDTPPNVFHLWLCFPSGHQHMVKLTLQSCCCSKVLHIFTRSFLKKICVKVFKKERGWKMWLIKSFVSSLYKRRHFRILQTWPQCRKKSTRAIYKWSVIIVWGVGEFAKWGPAQLYSTNYWWELSIVFYKIFWPVVSCGASQSIRRKLCCLKILQS